jgi:hypothetical protein
MTRAERRRGDGRKTGTLICNEVSGSAENAQVKRPIIALGRLNVLTSPHSLKDSFVFTQVSWKDPAGDHLTSDLCSRCALIGPSCFERYDDEHQWFIPRTKTIMRDDHNTVITLSMSTSGETSRLCRLITLRKSESVVAEDTILCASWG